MDKREKERRRRSKRMKREQKRMKQVHVEERMADKSMGTNEWDKQKTGQQREIELQQSEEDDGRQNKYTRYVFRENGIRREYRNREKK